MADLPQNSERTIAGQPLKRTKLLLTIVAFVNFLASFVFLWEQLAQSGFFTYVADLSNLPAAVFILIMLGDAVLGAKTPKYF